MNDLEKYFQAFDEVQEFFYEKSAFSNGLPKYLHEYYRKLIPQFTEVHRTGEVADKLQHYKGDDFSRDHHSLIMAERFNTSIESEFLKLYDGSKLDKNTFEAMRLLSAEFSGKSIPNGLIQFTRDMLNQNFKRPRKIYLGGDNLQNKLVTSLLINALKNLFQIKPMMNDARLDGHAELNTGCGLVAAWNLDRNLGQQSAKSYETVKKIWNSKLLEDFNEPVLQSEIGQILERIL